MLLVDDANPDSVEAELQYRKADCKACTCVTWLCQVNQSIACEARILGFVKPWLVKGMHTRSSLNLCRITMNHSNQAKAERLLV